MSLKRLSNACGFSQCPGLMFDFMRDRMKILNAEAAEKSHRGCGEHYT